MCGLAGEIAWPVHPVDGCGSRPCHASGDPASRPDGIGCGKRRTARVPAPCAAVAGRFLGGHQPMADPQRGRRDRLQRRDIRIRAGPERLEARGVVFRTRQRHGGPAATLSALRPDFVRDLEGEFAFVLVDRRNGQTMLARDRFGVKPLFFATEDGLLLFGSEAKAILAHPSSRRQLNMTVLDRELHGDRPAAGYAVRRHFGGRARHVSCWSRAAVCGRAAMPTWIRRPPARCDLTFERGDGGSRSPR